jgi:6-phosphogluconolactonase
VTTAVAGDVRVVDDVADAFVALLAEARPSLVALSGGTSARRCYEALRAAPDALTWEQVDVLFGDERWVDVTSPDSNEGMARAALLDHVAVRAIFSMRDAGPDPETAATAYEAMVASRASLDVVHLGLGPDGHTASLFPGSSTLDERERLVAPAGDDAHPHPRVTFTFPAIARFRLAVFTVEGAAKADAFARVLAGDDLPAGRVSAARVVWLVDHTAARR